MVVAVVALTSARVRDAPPRARSRAFARLHARTASYGFLLYGPGQKVWYAFLDRTFSSPGWRSFGAKVALNQLVLGPAVLVAVFTWNLGWQVRSPCS